MARASFDLTAPFRTWAESHSHLIVRSPSGEEGFAVFGGHRPRHYFSRLYLGTREHRVRLGFHGADVSASCRNLLREYGLVVFCGTTTPADLAGEVLQTPGMVDMTIPLPASPESFGHWSRSGRSHINKVRKAGFQCEVQTGEAWVGEFRRLFHEPAIAARHGAEAYTASERDLRTLARESGAELLRIVRDGVWVGGGLNRSEPDGYRMQRLGWRGGDPRLLNEGVVSAVYWFSILRAVELGHRCARLGGVSPYLEDGVLVYKSRWGARFEPITRRYGEFHLLLDPSHDTCRRFLAAHSLLARGSDGDLIVFSGRRPQETKVPCAILEGISRWYRWLERPEASSALARTEVPDHLRSWLVEEELPAVRLRTRA